MMDYNTSTPSLSNQQLVILLDLLIKILNISKSYKKLWYSKSLSFQTVSDSSSSDKIFFVLLDHIFEEKSFVAEFAIMILVNLSRNENIARIIYESLKDGDVIETIAMLASKTDHKYDYLPSLLANLTQLLEVRS